MKTSELSPRRAAQFIAFCWMVVLGAALLAFAGHAKAAHQLATDYTGFVVVDGKPAAGIPVVLRHPSTGRLLVRYTNAQGRYHFNNVRPDGIYAVEALGQTHERRAFQGTTFRHDFKGGAQ